MAEGVDGTQKFRDWYATSEARTLYEGNWASVMSEITPEDFMLNRHKMTKCVKMHPETAKQIEQGVSGQWKMPDGTIGNIAGVHVETDRYMPMNTAWMIPEAGDTPLTVLDWHPVPVESSEPAQPVPVVRKFTAYVTLREDEPYSIAHDMAFDCIVQVTSVMTGRPVEGLTVTKMARSVVLHWVLNDASPVEDPSINVCVVVIG